MSADDTQVPDNGAQVLDETTAATDSTVEGSKDARRQAVLVLELLTGLRGPTETSEALGCSVTRVYQLEARALQAVVTAMEPRPRGRQPDLERKVAEVEREKEAVTEELVRTQALLRAAYRTFGMPPSAATGKKDRKPPAKRRQKAVRARRAIARVAAAGDAPADAGKSKAGKSQKRRGKST